MPPLQVDDAQAPHPERDPITQVEPLIVRPPVDHGARHGLNQVQIHLPDDATDPTHNITTAPRTDWCISQNLSIS